MIVEDRYGNIYKINTPSYQAGGLVLPQYSGSQVTIQPPQSNLLNVPVNNDWNRGMQMDQLNMQREAAALNSVNTIIDTRIKMQTQERLNKQMDMQNKKLEWEQMKEGAKVIEETLKLSKDNLLGPDSVKFDELLKEQGYGADKIAGESDVMQIFKNKNAVNSLLYQQKQGLSNKANFIEMNKVLDDTDKLLKRADEVAGLGYLKEEVRDSLLTSATALRKKQMGLANGTNGGWDIYSDPDYLNVTSGVSFVDDAEFKLISDIKQKEAEADRAVRNINADVAMMDATSRQKLMPSQIIMNEANAAKANALAQQTLATTPYEIEKTKIETQILKDQMPVLLATATAKGQIDKAKADILMGKIAAFNKQYPNPTVEDYKILEGIIGAEETKKYTSFENMIVDLLNKGDYDKLEDVYDAMARAKQAEYIDKSTNSTVTHIKDGNGTTIGVKQADGGINYGGTTVDKDGVTPTSITIGSNTYLTDNSAAGAGKVRGIPDATVEMINNKGYLKIKGNNDDNLEWLFGKYPGFGSWWENDSVEGFQDYEGKPAGTKYEGGYLYIPQDNVALPQGGTTNSPSNINPAFKVNGGATAVPANAKDVL